MGVSKFIVLLVCLGTVKSLLDAHALMNAAPPPPPPPIWMLKMTIFWTVRGKIPASNKHPLEKIEKKKTILPYAKSLRICCLIAECTSPFFSRDPNKWQLQEISSPLPRTKVPSAAECGPPVISDVIWTILPSLYNCVQGWHKPSGICPTVVSLFFTTIALSQLWFSGSEK